MCRRVFSHQKHLEGSQGVCEHIYTWSACTVVRVCSYTRQPQMVIITALLQSRVSRQKTTLNCTMSQTLISSVLFRFLHLGGCTFCGKKSYEVWLCPLHRSPRTQVVPGLLYHCNSVQADLSSGLGHYTSPCTGKASHLSSVSSLSHSVWRCSYTCMSIRRPVLLNERSKDDKDQWRRGMGGGGALK